MLCSGTYEKNGLDSCIFQAWFSVSQQDCDCCEHKIGANPTKTIFCDLPSSVVMMPSECPTCDRPTLAHVVIPGYTPHYGGHLHQQFSLSSDLSSVSRFVSWYFWLLFSRDLKWYVKTTPHCPFNTNYQKSFLTTMFTMTMACSYIFDYFGCSKQLLVENYMNISS